MFRIVNFQNTHNFHRKIQEKPQNSFPEPKDPSFHLPHPHKFYRIPQKIPDSQNLLLPMKIPKPNRIVQSSQEKRSFSVKNLWQKNNFKEAKNSEEEFFFLNFKKKPSLFNNKPKKDILNEESINISVICSSFIIIILEL